MFQRGARKFRPKFVRNEEKVSENYTSKIKRPKFLRPNFFARIITNAKLKNF